MNQISLDGKKWVRDNPPEDDAEVLKLNIGETLVGILLEKKPSTKYDGKSIYKIQVKNDPIPKILVGTTILDKWMKNKEIGKELMIKRLPDIPTDKAQDMQNYETYSNGGEEA